MEAFVIMEKYKLNRNNYIFVVYVQNSGFDIFCCEWSHPESYSVFKLREHTHNVLTWFHSAI